MSTTAPYRFESFANSERYKTIKSLCSLPASLRALLIQKDTKPKLNSKSIGQCLRALLIQKDTKQLKELEEVWSGLRALLIQKDTKLKHRC